jgi:hypothetical protein
VKLPTGPCPGHQNPALHRAVALESVADRVEIGADDPDGAFPPHGPDPTFADDPYRALPPHRPDLTFYAARQGDREVRLKPVALAVSHETARGPHPVTIAHYQRVNVHSVT